MGQGILRDSIGIDLPKAGVLAFASRRLLDFLGQIATLQALETGEELFAQGDSADAVFFIETGLLEVSVVAADGKKLSLDILQPGDVVGEIALFDDGPRTATITARETARLWRLPRVPLQNALRRDPEFALDLLALAGKRMRWLTQQIHEQAFLGLEERLARKILHLTSHENGETVDTLEMPQGELAEFLAVTREAVSKILAGWKQQGLIELGRGKLVILDRAEVRMRAGFGFF